jgi:hypothetical protein
MDLGSESIPISKFSKISSHIREEIEELNLANRCLEVLKGTLRTQKIDI